MFVKDESGNIAVILGLALPALIMLIGVGVDMSSASSAKAKGQDLIDAAVLAAVHQTTEAEAKAVVNSFFSDYETTPVISEFEFINDGGSRSLTATVDAEHPLNFGAIIGKNTIPLTLSSSVSAPVSFSSLRISLDHANGFWGKTAQIIGRNGGTETIVATAEYEYDMSDLSSSFELDHSGWLDVSDYDEVLIEFTIDDDAHMFDEWCGLNGCPNKSFRSDDPLHSDRFYVDGVQQPVGTVLKLNDFAECGDSVSHEWEDGGGLNPDFGYSVEARCDGISSGKIRIIR